MANEVLTADQVQFYQDQGYLVVEDRVPEATLQAIRDEIARFIDIARGMDASDDKLDLEDSHRRDDPRVRRIKLPHTQSEVMRELLFSDAVLAPVRDLIGPNVRMQTTKLNMKSAGFGAAVEWHQDFAFYPYTNDDVLAVGVIIDDIGLENGPMMVFPGSHKGPIHNHHAPNAEGEELFIGAMDLAACGLDVNDAIPLTAKAGSLTIHHGRVIHGSALNRSDRDRRLLFYEMMAADAFPIMGAMVEMESMQVFDARMLCGEPTKVARMENVPVRIPQPQPSDKYGSIYEIQKNLRARAFEVAE